ncbi:MAG: hypothetical protein HKN30_11685 [Sulfitobacter sp.]|nr:hypothetical protein [Sulfitobacter sp.]
MTSDYRELASTILKIMMGGFVGTLVATYLAAQWEERREQREALQNLVSVWHSNCIEDRRDAIPERCKA